MRDRAHAHRPAPIRSRYTSSRLGRTTARPGTSPPNCAASPVTISARLRRLHGPPAVGSLPADQGLLHLAAAEVSGGAQCDHPAASTATRSASASSLRQVVRGQQDRGPACGQVPDQFPELPSGFGIEARRRLIQEQQLRPSDDAQRDIEPSSLPAGQLVTAPPLQPGQAGELDDLGRVARPRVVARELADHLGHRELRLSGQLQNDADSGPPAPPRACRILAQYRHRAAIPGAEALEDLHRVVLPAPFGPEQREYLAAADVEVDVIHCHRRAVALAEPADADRKITAHGHQHAAGLLVRAGQAAAPVSTIRWTPRIRPQREG